MQAVDLGGQPVGGKLPVALHQMAVDLTEKAGMAVAHHLAEIRDAADLPQQAHVVLGFGQSGQLLIPGQGGQGQFVVGLAGPGQPFGLGSFEQGFTERRQGGKIKIGIAPVDHLQGVEGVVFNAPDQIVVQRPDLGGGAEGAVVHVTPGPAGDLGQFRRGQLPEEAAVEFSQAREGDMVDIHVEAHADGVGGHQVIDLAGLVQGDLGVAGAGAEGAEDDGGAAPLAADQFGNGVNVSGREDGDGAARRQAGNLLLAGVGERRKTGPGNKLDTGDQRLQQGLDGVGSHQHGFVEAAGMQQAVGKNMAAVRIGAHLHLVDAEEGHLAVDRHGFGGAQEILGPGRHDLFLAGDQRHLVGALNLDGAVVIFPGQQAQGKPDDAGVEPQHALHGHVGLAGIGGAEDGDDARPLRFGIDLHRLRIQFKAVLGKRLYGIS